MCLFFSHQSEITNVTEFSQLKTENWCGILVKPHFSPFQINTACFFLHFKRCKCLSILKHSHFIFTAWKNLQCFYLAVWENTQKFFRTVGRDSPMRILMRLWLIILFDECMLSSHICGRLAMGWRRMVKLPVQYFIMNWQKCQKFATLNLVTNILNNLNEFETDLNSISTFDIHQETKQAALNPYSCRLHLSKLILLAGKTNSKTVLFWIFHQQSNWWEC